MNPESRVYFFSSLFWEMMSCVQRAPLNSVSPPFRLQELLQPGRITETDARWVILKHKMVNSAREHTERMLGVFNCAPLSLSLPPSLITSVKLLLVWTTGFLLVALSVVLEAAGSSSRHWRPEQIDRLSAPLASLTHRDRTHPFTHIQRQGRKSHWWTFPGLQSTDA